MQKREDERFASLVAMESFTGTHIDVREIIGEWILLTYDVPHTEEGDKIRSEFLKKAKKLGAVQHTESVYLLPWTPQSELLALEVAKVGHAFLWTSNVKDEAKATELTTKYDTDILTELMVIRDRIKRIHKHLENGKDGIAAKMIKKTKTMLKDAADIAARRGSVDLCKKVNSLLDELDTLRPSKKVTNRKNISYDPKTMSFEEVEK